MKYTVRAVRSASATKAVGDDDRRSQKGCASQRLALLRLRARSRSVAPRGWPGMTSPPPPPVSGELGDWATFAVAQRHSKKQEDKFLVKVLTTDGTASWADFCCAVLDGHNGRRAAETCAALLPSIVSEELARLCAASGVTHEPHADASSPNWHPQVRRAPLCAAHWGPALWAGRPRGA